MGIVNEASEEIIKKRQRYVQSQIKSLESEDSQISSLIREQYSQVREYDLIHEALINLANAGVFAREDLGENYNQFLEFRQKCIDEVKGKETEYYINLSFDGETYEKAFLSKYKEGITWEDAINNDITVNGMYVGSVNDIVYLDKMLLTFKDTEVKTTDEIYLMGDYVIHK